MRSSPAVPGTLSGHGGWRSVFVRAQYRTPPVIGLKWNVSGPHAPATPSDSSSITQITSFCQMIGSRHVSARSSGFSPVVSAATAHPMMQNASSLKT